MRSVDDFASLDLRRAISDELFTLVTARQYPLHPQLAQYVFFMGLKDISPDGWSLRQYEGEVCFTAPSYVMTVPLDFPLVKHEPRGVWYGLSQRSNDVAKQNRDYFRKNRISTAEGLERRLSNGLSIMHAQRAVLREVLFDCLDEALLPAGKFSGDFEAGSELFSWFRDTDDFRRYTRAFYSSAGPHLQRELVAEFLGYMASEKGFDIVGTPYSADAFGSGFSYWHPVSVPHRTYPSSSSSSSSSSSLDR